MDDLVAKKYMIIQGLSQDLGIDSPKISLGKICKCEIRNKDGKTIFVGCGSIADIAIEECYKSLLEFIKKKEEISAELKSQLQAMGVYSTSLLHHLVSNSSG
ncbi:MAG: hypothetical protein KAT49_00770 [Methanomicrobia archaeon]|nr:hypothetical protein [Methanomicrobia archaeon]